MFRAPTPWVVPMPPLLLQRHVRLNADEWRRLSDVAQEFEAAWWQTFGPAIGEFLPEPDDPLPMRLLIELIRIDQELRWQRGQKQILEACLERWPELTSSPDALLELLEAECLTRAVFAVVPTEHELQARFPQLAGRINLAQVQALALAERSQASTDQKYDGPTLIQGAVPAAGKCRGQRRRRARGTRTGKSRLVGRAV